MNKIEFGDCREIMRKWAEDGVKAQTCVTSPPYFGLRTYLQDAVKLRSNLSKDELQFVLSELQKLNISPR